MYYLFNDNTVSFIAEIGDIIGSQWEYDRTMKVHTSWKFLEGLPASGIVYQNAGSEYCLSTHFSTKVSLPDNGPTIL